MDGETWLKIVSLAIINLIALFGNLLMLFVGLNSKYLRKFQNAFIFNMAFADFMQAILIMPTAFFTLYNSKWIFSNNACKGFAATKATISLVSVYSLAGIGLQRYFFVVKNTTQLRSKNFSIFGIFIVWGFSLLLSTTPFYGFGKYGFELGREVCTILFDKNIFHTLIIALTAVILNIVVIIKCYCHIYSELRSYKVAHQSDNFSSPSTVWNEDSLQNERKSLEKRNIKISTKEFQLLKTISIIVVTFVLCWVPYAIFNIIRVLKWSENIKFINTITTWLGFLNCALNPLIYGVLNKQFQKAMINILFCRKKTR